MIKKYLEDYGDNHVLLLYNSFKTNYPNHSDSIIIHKMLKLYLHDIKSQEGFSELMNISLRRAEFCTNVLEQFLEN